MQLNFARCLSYFCFFCLFFGRVYCLELNLDSVFWGLGDIERGYGRVFQ